MLKHFFIPTKHNAYTPHLLSRKALIVYLVVLCMFNFVFGSLPGAKVEAAVDINNLYVMHNDERLKYGLQTLTINTALVSSATAKAQAMMTADCWSHYCPNGKSPWDFFDAAGYTYIYAGENLAEGFDSNESVMNAWLNSPSHRANILKPEFDEIGIGYAIGRFQGIDNNTLIVVHFGSRTNKVSTLPQTGGTSGGYLAITSPADGSYLSDNRFDLKGTAPSNTQISIEDSGRHLGDVNASGESFIYRPSVPYQDGLHLLTVSAFENNSKVAEAGPVHVTVDTIAPTIVANTVHVTSLSYQDQEQAIMSLKTQDNPVTLASNINNHSFLNTSGDNWEMQVAVSELSGKDTLVIEARDKAGNTSSLSVSTQGLLAEIKKLEGTSPKPDSTQSTAVLSFLSTIFQKDTKAQLNILFALFLSFLFAIDFYVLAKSGLTGVERSKSHLHLSTFIILILITLIGGLSGQILTAAAKTT